ncbi:DNA-directed RNA polymerase [Anoxybacillus vitaminiphilus]|uniref:DNA-directed RNA polymerase n=1 Tax=Paranoxybacillus vitaminiphilus TaxID=581036 RepID=A0A327YTR1_9BACL|nr:sigma-70 family RNA polymerase sigma factor [Anoxybacillus vitaminiphilus]RAK23135.1 DNA-directed RNA polymerase [Anoxybacillus vitaminiphilus]
MKQAFEELVTAYHPMIISIMKRLHITKEFDEYYQIGLIALWEAYEQFQKEKGNLSSFIYKKIYWKIVSHLRKQLNTKVNECTFTDEMTEILAASPIQREFSEKQLETMFKDLSPYQRKWLIAYIFQGKNLKQIAFEEGVSIGAVKQWRVKALRKLRRRWHLYEDLFITP